MTYGLEHRIYVYLPNQTLTITRENVNPWITNTMLDSCAFDPKYHPEQEAAEELFRLHREQQLPILIAHSIQKEIEHPNTPGWVKREALGKVFSVQVENTCEELSFKRKLLALLAGNGKPQSIAADTEHIFEAQKYCSYFVTTDKRLLDKASDVHALCRLSILRPSEFLGLVQSYAPPK